MSTADPNSLTLHINDPSPATLADLRATVAGLADRDGATRVDIHLGHTNHQGWNCCKCPTFVGAAAQPNPA